MDQRSLARLGYPTILEQLAKCSVSSLGRELAENLQPSTDWPEIVRWQQETTEARDLLRLEPLADLGGWQDIRPWIVQASRGIMLEPSDFWQVALTLGATRRAKKFLQERDYPLLKEISEFLGEFKDLEDQILKTIKDDGSISDQASPELARIRRTLGQLQSQIKSKLEHLIRSSETQKYLQDAIITQRGNRYVVPVKQEYRNQIPGVIHDQSASGATLFIEPMAVVEANNEIRRLEVAHEQEIIRILSQLSQMLGLRQETLLASQRALAHLDFILAKARYSLKINASAVQIVPEARLKLQKARHPILVASGVKVVPVDLSLGQDFSTIIITGPNTGGKTVTLKTAGILCLMAQSGLHLPADLSSEVGIFSDIFADIGDEQSLEQSLSTFSAHLTNIVEILKQQDTDSLVLLDELGAGTDPVEGAALAEAILADLHTSGAKTIATTHYGALKQFAYNTAGVENASVEFDVVSLQPTYRLLVGTPGRSNAFEIARRLGLQDRIIEQARHFLGEEQLQVSEMMLQLEREKQISEQLRLEAEQSRAEAEELRLSWQRKEQELQERKQQILAKAREEARQMVRDFRLEGQEAIRELKESLKDASARNRDLGIQAGRRRLQKMQEKLPTEAPKAVRQKADPAQLKAGQEVFLPQYNQKAYILSPPSGSQVLVQVGIMKVQVSTSQLELCEASLEQSRRSKFGSLISGKAQNIATQLDIRGKTFAEAWPEVEKYLDDALVAGLPQVSLIHGKGTGALRAAIQQALRNYPRINSFRLGETGEGGAGVTVVELK
ncbi:MAG: endonuclease MutS2 [Clostridia bacterium]|nr:endonuclease MutS2 [Clostridia bacterium]